MTDSTPPPAVESDTKADPDANLPSNGDLAAAIRKHVSAQGGDLSLKAVRIALEEKFGCKLETKKDFIKDIANKAIAEKESSDSSDSSDDSDSDASGAPRKRPRAAAATRKPSARRTTCPISRKEWAEHSPEVEAACVLGDLKLPMTARDFSSGNFGWGLYGKHQVRYTLQPGVHYVTHNQRVSSTECLDLAISLSPAPQVTMAGKEVTVSITCNLTVVNSKDAK